MDSEFRKQLNNPSFEGHGGIRPLKAQPENIAAIQGKVIYNIRILLERRSKFNYCSSE